MRGRKNAERAADEAAHLGAADDGREGTLGIADGAVQVVELLLEEESGDGGLEELGDAGSRGVGAVRRAESIVNVPAGSTVSINIAEKFPEIVERTGRTEQQASSKTPCCSSPPQDRSERSRAGAPDRS